MHNSEYRISLVTKSCGIFLWYYFCGIFLNCQGTDFSRKTILMFRFGFSDSERYSECLFSNWYSSLLEQLTALTDNYRGLKNNLCISFEALKGIKIKKKHGLKSVKC